MRAGSTFRTAGPENVTSASAPVSHRVALCAGSQAGVAVVTHEREIRLVGAIWAEVRDWTRAAQVPGRKVCRLKGLCRQGAA